MGESYQVRCPVDGKQHVVEVDETGRVCWCSRPVGKPACTQKCLRQFRTVAFLMHTDVPTFEEAELECLTYDQVVQRFETLPFERLPVLSEGRPIGTLAIRDVALWKDNREFRLLLSQKEWGETADHLRAEQYLHDENCFLKLSDPWEKAVEHLVGKEGRRPPNRCRLGLGRSC